MFHRAPTRRTVTDLLEAQRKGTRRETLQLRAGRSCSLRNRPRVRKTAILAVELDCLHPAVEDGHPGRGNASHVNILLSKI